MEIMIFARFRENRNFRGGSVYICVFMRSDSECGRRRRRRMGRYEDGARFFLIFLSQSLEHQRLLAADVVSESIEFT